jgi:hypothetical protein
VTEESVTWMTSFRDFFVDFGVSGTIAGVGLGSRPDEWPAALGERYFEASWKAGHLVRQFGFVDAHFEVVSGEWICNLIQVTAPKVAQFDDMVPAVIGEKYGPFPARVPFDELAEVAAGRGAEVCHLSRIDDVSPEQYWMPDGKVMFWVVSERQAGEQPELRIGDVWSASTDARVDIPKDQQERYR